MKPYRPKYIEKKWRAFWEKQNVYREYGRKKSFYVLDMFPYPSGAGLHVGHPKGYIATDVVARMKQMQGYGVLHPMGWDAFGLPAENYAIKNKIHPSRAVKKNIATFKKQLEQIGFTYDWDREINTTDPEYYRWTQWIFLQLYKHGLAYESYEPINWCPSCQTGLANEDLENGRCERCGSEVEKKPMRQWVLRMTEYADRLLRDLDTQKLDWEIPIVTQQKNWIGRSEGAEVSFEISTGKKHFVLLHGYTGSPKKNFFPWLRDELEKRGHTVEVPELPHSKNPTEEEQVSYVLKHCHFPQNTVLLGHSLGTVVALRVLERLEKPISELLLVAGFTEPSFKDHKRPFEQRFKWKFDVRNIRSKADSVKILRAENDSAIPARQADALRELTGGEIINFVAEKDHATGTQEPTILENCVEKIRVYTTRLDTIFGCTYVVVAPEHPLVATLLQAHNPNFTIHNRAEVEKYLEATTKKSELERTELGKEKTGVRLGGVDALNPFTGERVPVFIADYVLGSYGTGAVMAVPAHDVRDNEFAKKYGLPIRTVILPEMKSEGETSSENGNAEVSIDDGMLLDSGEFSGLSSVAAREKMTTWLRTKKLGGKKVNYKMRDWVFSRQRYWGEPIPIIHCAACGTVPVPEKDLPVLLPNVKSYVPTGTGESPLADIEKWVKTTCPKCHGPARRETNTMPQWAGSSWYYLRYIDPKNTRALVDKKREAAWMPVDLYVGGAEHATRHLLYARFWHKFLFDIGVVSTKEPFKKLVHVGLILAADGRKMSKRYGNVINPDDIIGELGADSLRVYEMFMGPFTQNIAWSTEGAVGARRFLERVWRLSERVTGELKGSNENTTLESLVHRTIQKVTDDIEGFKFNTAVSALMILVNAMEKETLLPLRHWRSFLKLLSPFAPHMSEELWANLGEKQSIFLESWPKYDAKKTKNDMVEIVVQVNGKVRDRLRLSADTSDDTLREAALASERVKSFTEGQEIRRVIVVAGKLVNIVV